MTDPIRVFDLRGVYVFRYDGAVPPSLESAYNEYEDRYEVSDRGDLEKLPADYEVVDDPDDYRVRFRRDPPADLRRAAVFVEEGPMATTLVCPDEAVRQRALEAGGERVE